MSIIHPKKFVRAITDLSSSSQMLDPSSIIEISRNSKTYRTNLEAIDKEIIDEFPLYTNLNDIFNSLKHHNQTYFNPANGKTKFLFNPYVHEPTDSSTDYDDLLSNHLITKSKLEEYIDEVGICVPACKPDSPYIYYVAEETRWKTDNSKKPKVIDFHKDGIWTSNSKLKFRYGNNRYFYTDEVTAKRNIMLDVTGNIVLDVDYSDNWYELQHYFVALTVGGKVVTLLFLKNILKLDKYTIAQFHLHFPIGDETKFRIVTNAPCKLFGLPKSDPFPRKLYNSLNAVNLSYYDIGSTALFNKSELSPERDDEDPDPTPGPEPHPTEYITKTFIKIWNDDDNPVRRPESLNVKIWADNVLYKTITLNDANDWQTVESLPKYQDDGYTLIAYSWGEDESDLPEGYEYYETVVEGDTIKFINTYTAPQVDITIQKVWVPPTHSAIPNEVVVKLFADNREIDSIPLTDPWTHTSTVDKYDSNTGEEITYAWEEVTPSGFESRQETVDYTTTITNTFIVPKVDVSIQKVWDNDDNPEPPDEVDVTLYGDGVEVDTVTLTDVDDWSYTFTGLNKYQDNTTTPINYTWTEEPIENYTSTKSTDDYSTIITNTYVKPAPPPSVDLTIIKDWDNDDDPEPPSSATMKLLGNSGVVATVVLNAANNWTATVTDLPTFDEDEEEIFYNWIEDDSIPSDKYSKRIEEIDDYTTKITNIYHEPEPPSTVDLTVRKVWDNTGNPYPPDEITVKLFANNEEINSVILNGINGWSETIDGLPRKDGDGEIINYSWEEVTIPDYTTQKSTSGNTTTFTNTYNYPGVVWNKSHSSNWFKDPDYPELDSRAAIREMNVISPKLDDTEYETKLKYATDRYVDHFNVFICNRDDVVANHPTFGSEGRFSIYGDSISDNASNWTINSEYCSIMLNRIQSLKQKGYGIILWLMADDDGTIRNGSGGFSASGWNRALIANWNRYCSDINAQGFFDYADAVVVGLEINEYSYNTNNEVQNLISTLRNYLPAGVKIGVHTGGIGHGESPSSYISQVSSFYNGADVLFLQSEPECTTSEITALITAFKNTQQFSSKDIYMFETERWPNREKCIAAFNAGACAVGNWESEN